MSDFDGRPRSCVESRKRKRKSEIISSIDITYLRASVFYGKSPVGHPLQPEAAAAAAVVGTVWFLHLKAGPFVSCFLSAQGRLSL